MESESESEGKGLFGSPWEKRGLLLIPRSSGYSFRVFWYPIPEGVGGEEWGPGGMTSMVSESWGGETSLRMVPREDIVEALNFCGTRHVVDRDPPAKEEVENL